MQTPVVKQMLSSFIVTTQHGNQLHFSNEEGGQQKDVAHPTYKNLSGLVCEIIYLKNDSYLLESTFPANCPQAASISLPRFFRVIVIKPAAKRISRKRSIVSGVAH